VCKQTFPEVTFAQLFPKVALAHNHFSKKWYKTLAQPFQKVEG